MQLCEGPLTSKQWPVPGKLEGRSGSIADVASESALCDVPHISNHGSSEPAHSAARKTRPLRNELTRAASTAPRTSRTSYL